ncbi:hypothetical protein ACFWAY_53405 [Rhodococcus sp. NPDC059968]|uniref:hypothetical protein n=1 Tax=Rhodococcus sp. NPDC059968 TaxID=3347017 RepID=UPI00366F8C45
MHRHHRPKAIDLSCDTLDQLTQSGLVVAGDHPRSARRCVVVPTLTDGTDVARHPRPEDHATGIICAPVARVYVV